MAWFKATEVFATAKWWRGRRDYQMVGRGHIGDDDSTWRDSWLSGRCRDAMADKTWWMWWMSMPLIIKIKKIRTTVWPMLLVQVILPPGNQIFVPLPEQNMLQLQNTIILHTNISHFRLSSVISISLLFLKKLLFSNYRSNWKKYIIFIKFNF